ncbi:MAG: hypothetical protein LCH89_20710 [Proteobacteria bacterium]|nr:hypothetical protein [Pseudomonadota bacterium]
MTLLPPGLLSTTTAWPRVVSSSLARVRAAASAPWPAGKGTTSLMVRLGNSSAAWARVGARHSVRARALAVPMRRRRVGRGRVGMVSPDEWGIFALFSVWVDD